MKQFTNSSTYDAKRSFIGYAGDKAESLKNKILNTPNTEEIYEITGKKYYISKDMPISDIPENLESGDAVLFERGGLWRVGTSTIEIPNGVIFGAYGDGEKPKFYGSLKNFADNSLWQKEENIWKIHLTGGNVGIMVFDNTYILGVKKLEFDDVKENYDFYYNPEDEDLYFYYDGDIATDFKSIEIGQRGDIFSLRSNSIADNLCVKYTGAHGIVVPCNRENCFVTNCEVSYIGGSLQFGTTRYGNGIEMQLGVKNVKVNNNWVFQCYDAGITFQSWSSANIETFYHNIEISDNLVEFCYYGLEFFTTSPKTGGLYSEIKNVSVARNIFRFSGYAWSYEQRPDHWMNAHIRSSQRGLFEATENFTFNDNVFDCSRANIVFWWWHDVERDFINPIPHPGVSAKNNSFYQAPMPDKRCMTYYEVDPIYAEDIEGLRKAAYRFDSEPKEIVWVEKIG